LKNITMPGNMSGNMEVHINMVKVYNMHNE